MKIKIFIALIFTALAAESQAQAIRTGFKTGLNFAHIDGPSETDPAGKNLESWKNVTGFHIGMTLAHRFNKNFSLRGEVLYSKKGGKYTFETDVPGASYKIFDTPQGRVFTTSEKARYLVNVNNSYIDIPLLAVARFNDFEISAGAGIGILLSSVGDGSSTYSGKTVPLGNPTGDLQFNLDYNYRKDDPGGFTEGSEMVAVKLDAQNIQLPKTIGAYYDRSEDLGALYKPLDVSAYAGVSYYLSRALYLSGRLQYGLSDITNNDADVSRTKVGDNNAPVLRDDKDVNFNIQVSVGFSF